MKEVWVNIKGYEGAYQVSNLGNVRSVDREILMSHGGIKFLEGKMLKLNEDNLGYLRVNLYDKKKNKKTWRVHQLVGINFLDNEDGHTYVNHINRDKLDNRVENLVWVSRYENNSRGATVLNELLKERK